MPLSTPPHPTEERPTSERSTGQGARPGAGGGVRVLVVDDDLDIRVLAGKRLEQHGFVVRSVDSGEAALEHLEEEEEEVDLILLDYRLPGRNGLETLRLLRARGGPSVVLATGDGSTHVAVEALRAGAVDYLGKSPRFLDELPGVMERAWRAHDLARRADELQRQALLVSGAVDREGTLSSIVSGAHDLLRSDGCALFTLGPAGPALEASSGALPDDLAGVARAAAAMLRSRGRGEIGLAAEDVVLVPLRTAGAAAALGALAIFMADDQVLQLEELRLAEVFASFAGIALANLGRFALEQEMVAKLQDLVTTRRQLLTGVSHELRTPLTCINGFASTLLTHDEVLTPELRQESVEAIFSHTGELMRLVEQLLQVAEAEEGRTAVTVAPTELAGTVRSTLTLLAPLLGDRELTLELPDAWVRADPVLLRRVIANLLSNAAKYSPATTPIEVRIRDGEQGPDWVAVDVTDHGPGLDASEAARVFEPFWRTSGPLRDQVRGAGVGLALVQEYVAVMGGRVAVRSEVGHGATFTVHLRRATPPDPTEPTGQNSRSSSDSSPRSAS
jgi:signal transduction histidine kinase/FixJ family two-component response regulator